MEMPRRFKVGPFWLIFAVDNIQNLRQTASLKCQQTNGFNLPGTLPLL